MTRHARAGATFKSDGTLINVADLGEEILASINDLTVNVTVENVTFKGQTVGAMVADAGFLQLHEAPDGTMQPSFIDAGGRVGITLDGVPVEIGNFPAEFPLPADQVQTNALTDAELRAAPLDVGNFPAEFPLPVGQVQTDALTDAQLREAALDVRARTADNAFYVEPRRQSAINQPSDGTAGTAAYTDPDGIVRAALSDAQGRAVLGSSTQMAGFTTDAGVLRAINSNAYLGGSAVQSTTNSLRGLLRNPAGSGRVLVVSFIIVAHDEGNSVVDMEIIRSPTTNLPTTAQNVMNFNIIDEQQEEPQGQLLIDTGSGMSGNEADIFVPTQGNNPNPLTLTTPLLVWPGLSVGANFDIGGTLSSADAAMSVAWVEIPVAEINLVREAHGQPPFQGGA